MEGNCGQIGVGCWEMRVYLSFTSYFVYLFSITSKSGCATMILISLSGVLAYTKKNGFLEWAVAAERILSLRY